MKLKLEITFTNLIGAIGFLSMITQRLKGLQPDTEILMWSVVLVLGRKFIPVIADTAKAIATILTAKGKK